MDNLHNIHSIFSRNTKCNMLVRIIVYCTIVYSLLCSIQPENKKTKLIVVKIKSRKERVVEFETTY